MSMRQLTYLYLLLFPLLLLGVFVRFSVHHRFAVSAPPIPLPCSLTWLIWSPDAT